MRGLIPILVALSASLTTITTVAALPQPILYHRDTSAKPKYSVVPLEPGDDESDLGESGSGDNKGNGKGGSNGGDNGNGDDSNGSSGDDDGDEIVTVIETVVKTREPVTKVITQTGKPLTITAAPKTVTKSVPTTISVIGMGDEEEETKVIQTVTVIPKPAAPSPSPLKSKPANKPATTVDIVPATTESVSEIETVSKFETSTQVETTSAIAEQDNESQTSSTETSQITSDTIPEVGGTGSVTSTGPAPAAETTSSKPTLVRGATTSEPAPVMESSALLETTSEVENASPVASAPTYEPESSTEIVELAGEPSIGSTVESVSTEEASTALSSVTSTESSSVTSTQAVFEPAATWVGEHQPENSPTADLSTSSTILGSWYTSIVAPVEIWSHSVAVGLESAASWAPEPTTTESLSMTTPTTLVTSIVQISSAPALDSPPSPESYDNGQWQTTYPAWNGTA